ncbi:hypothetical protein [Roseicitreum antarcticum]|uniref:hypothetical protein n=1 Tax=Roseicitreum antarcticum TaxID=564137 RepID=UPI00168063BD|nr:hypothetical protein [Roseicitreum antarcticum]
MSRGVIQQVGHVAYEVAYAITSILSRMINALLRGSMHQTTSSRAYVESQHSAGWARGRRAINALFFWQNDHCAEAWASEVNRARKVLERNDALGGASET